MGKRKERIDGAEMLVYVTFVVIIFLIFAPSETFDYTIKFISLIILLIILYFTFDITIGDKIRSRKYKRALKEEEDRAKWAREIADRHKQKREG